MRIYLVPAFMLLFAACDNDVPGTNSADTTPVIDKDDKARTLFQQNCATCHNMVKNATGPALSGVLLRWNSDTARLKAFIRDPSRLISEGDPNAVKTAEAFKPAKMPAFPNLSDDDLNCLIAHYH